MTELSAAALRVTHGADHELTQRAIAKNAEFAKKANVQKSPSGVVYTEVN